MSGARPPSEWPLILCGPMLRRVTTHEVCVFIALRQPARVRLLLFTDPQGATAVGVPQAPVDTLALGQRLHVIAVRLQPSSALSAGVRYYYDLEITRLRDGAETSDTLRTLNDAPLMLGGEFTDDGPNLLAGEHPLGGTAGHLPGFSLAADLDELALIHASCRKAHGEGPDMLAFAEQLLDAADPGERPHQLALTGDQIYADDVALALSQIVAATAPELLTGVATLRLPTTAAVTPNGYHGEMPSAGNGSDPPGQYMNADELAPGGRRQSYVKGQTGLSVDEGDSAGHLLYLGEFYAMYLLAWSPALWPVDAGGEPQLELATLLLADDEDKRAEFEAAAVKQRSRLREFFHRLPRVRRLLANVPTYMVLDDHEVSDDWNLSHSTANKVMQRAAGRQVVRNALLAYAVFQDWGNRPGEYAAGATPPPGHELLLALGCEANPAGFLHPPQSLPPVLKTGGAATRVRLDALLGLATNPAAPPEMDWHFHVDFPSHLLIALDTRSRRLLPPDNSAAGIIDPDHLPLQLAVPRLAHPGLTPLIIAPGPVFDLHFPTEILKDGSGIAFRALLGRFARPLYEKVDRETWSGNRAALAALVGQLVRFERVVLLSGDVHYAFSNDVAARVGNDRVRIAQLCASPANNEGLIQRSGIPASKLAASTFPLLLDHPYLIELGEDPDFAANLRTAIEDKAEQLRAVGDPRDELIRYLVLSALSVDLAQTVGAPVALPLAHWHATPGLEELGETPPPDPVPRCEVRALRAAPQPRFSNPDFAAPSDQAWIVDHRQVVGVNNIGLVRFGPGDQLRHTLFWFGRELSGANTGLWVTEHQLTLAEPPPGTP